MIETAFMIVFFLAFVLLLSDGVKMCYDWISLQYAVNQTSRWGILGLQDSGMTHQASMIARVQQTATELGLPGNQVRVRFYNPSDTSGVENNSMVNSPENFLVMRADLDITTPFAGAFFNIVGDLGGPNFNLMAQALVRNEPFS